MRLLTVKEVADMTGLRYEAVRQLIIRGDLKAINICTDKRKIWRVSEDSLNQFIRQGA